MGMVTSDSTMVQRRLTEEAMAICEQKLRSAVQISAVGKKSSNDGANSFCGLRSQILNSDWEKGAGVIEQPSAAKSGRDNTLMNQMSERDSILNPTQETLMANQTEAQNTDVSLVPKFIENSVTKQRYRRQMLTNSQTGSNISLKNMSKTDQKARSSKNGANIPKSHNIFQKNWQKTLKIEKKAKSQLGKEYFQQQAVEKTTTSKKMNKTNQNLASLENPFSQIGDKQEHQQDNISPQATPNGSSSRVNIAQTTSKSPQIAASNNKAKNFAQTTKMPASQRQNQFLPNNAQNNQHQSQYQQQQTSEDPQSMLPQIRQGTLFKDQDIKLNLLEIYQQVHRRDQALGSGIIPQSNLQMQQIRQKDQDLLLKIENEISRRQNQQIPKSTTLSPSFTGTMGDVFSQILMQKTTQSAKHQQNGSISTSQGYMQSRTHLSEISLHQRNLPDNITNSNSQPFNRSHYNRRLADSHNQRITLTTKDHNQVSDQQTQQSQTQQLSLQSDQQQQGIFQWNTGSLVDSMKGLKKALLKGAVNDYQQTQAVAAIVKGARNEVANQGLYPPNASAEKQSIFGSQSCREELKEKTEETSRRLRNQYKQIEFQPESNGGSGCIIMREKKAKNRISKVTQRDIQNICSSNSKLFTKQLDVNNSQVKKKATQTSQRNTMQPDNKKPLKPRSLIVTSSANDQSLKYQVSKPQLEQNALGAGAGGENDVNTGTTRSSSINHQQGNINAVAWLRTQKNAKQIQPSVFN